MCCSYEWVDDDTIGALVVPAERDALPERPPVPIGPNIQDNTSGKTSQVWIHAAHPQPLSSFITVWSIGLAARKVGLLNSALLLWQARTYPDLLKSPYDEELFDYYGRSNLIYVKVNGCLCLSTALLCYP